MWCFHTDNNSKTIIVPGKEYVIGRRDCDIVIENDQSVSRKHAVLKVTHADANVPFINRPATIVIRDISKFGSFVNNQKVKGEEKQLQNGDNIRFGNPKSIHTVVYEPFVVTTSCLDGPAKKDVRRYVGEIGGHLSTVWSKDCSYLIMKTVTVTIKVVCALVSQKHIVTPDFLQHLLKYFKGEASEKPDPAKYLPPVTEQMVEPGVSFHPAAERASVFQGMMFHFLSEKQFKKMSFAVEEGGGVPVLSDNPNSGDLEAFLEVGAVVMNPAPGEVTDKRQKEWVEKVKSFLGKKGKYLVHDAEVGYAVLYRSTDTYCNPDRDISHLLSMVVPSQSQAADTQASQSQAPAGNHHTWGSKQTATAGSPLNSATGKSAGSSQKTDRSEGDKGGTADLFALPESISGVFRKMIPVSGQNKTASVAEESVKDEFDLQVPETELGSATSPPRYEPETASSSCRDHQSSSRLLVPDLAQECAGDALHKRRSRSPTPQSKLSKSAGHNVSKSLTRVFHGGTENEVVFKPAEDKALLSLKVEQEDLLSVHTTLSGSHHVPKPCKEGMSHAKVIKKEKDDTVAYSKPINFFDDEEEEIVQPTMRKTAPSRNRRELSEDASDEEEDPFEFVKKSGRNLLHTKLGSDRERAVETSLSPGRNTRSSKHSRTSSSPERSPSPVAESRGNKRSRRSASPAKSPSPVAESRGNKRSRRSASPAPSPVAESRDNKRSRRSASPAKSRSASPAKSPSPVSESRGNKRSRRSASPAKSPSPVPESRGNKRSRRSASPAKSPSPVPESLSSKRLQRPPMSNSEPQLKMQTTLGNHYTYTSSRLRSLTDGATASSSKQGLTPDSKPVPRGFLTTRKPIKDQVEVNPNFERENIESSTVQVEFEDLVNRKKKGGHQNHNENKGEESEDVPQGMVRWKGQLVRNFKKFSKTRHAGSNYLPRIIGGRDLQEYCASSKKVLDDWLKDLHEAESQQNDQEREAQELFDWKPPARGSKARR